MFGGRCERTEKSSSEQVEMERIKIEQSIQQVPATLETNGKSYLRSQYERRQRQMQLVMMNSNCAKKMQLEPDESTAGGASTRRAPHQRQLPSIPAQAPRQQQDLVAMSHELSKRRFFEKLERRELAKNSNLGTQAALVTRNRNDANSRLIGYGGNIKPAQQHLIASKSQTSKLNEENEEAATMAITKQLEKIRDVLPQANRINRPLGIVSNANPEDGWLEILESAEKVASEEENAEIPINEQFNEKITDTDTDNGVCTEHRRDEMSPLKFANDYANLPEDDEQNEAAPKDTRENNVNHDIVGIDDEASCSNETSETAKKVTGIDLTDANQRQEELLIEPFDDHVLNSDNNAIMVQNDGQQSSPAIEEDRGSSCSSSGFGASVSVTSVSESGSGCLMGKDPTIGSARPIKLEIGHQFWHQGTAPNLAQKSITPSSDYETNCGTMRRVRTQGIFGQKRSDDYGDYKRLVKSDKNPSEGLEDFGLPQVSTTNAIATTMIVENLNYAVVNRCPMPGSDVGIILEKDEFINPGYVNFPQGRRSTVGYATVRSPANSRDRQQKFQGKSFNDTASDASFSEQSSTTDSANSAGFSALPPAKVDCPSSNNFESLNSPSIENFQQRKSSSLLKRFGSLVSRTFTHGIGLNNQTAPQSSAPTGEELHRLAQQQRCANGKEQSRPGSNNSANEDACAELTAPTSLSNANCGNSKTSASLCKQAERTNQEDDWSGLQTQINLEADLVILPGKCTVNTNQRKQVVVDRKLQLEQSDPRCKSSQKSRRRGHSRHYNVKLSRIRNYSRNNKMRQQVDLSSSVTSISSTLSYSTSSNSTEYHQKHRPLKSVSLSEELESLVSESIETDSLEQGGGKENKHLAVKSLKFRPSTRLLQRQPHCITSTTGCIDIDCVSPGGSKMKGENSAKRQTSLSCLFNSALASHQTAESSPNLTNSSKNRRSKTAHDGHEEEQKQREPISGFWGFPSLMEPNHAIGKKFTKNGGKIKLGKSKNGLKSGKELEESSSVDHDSLISPNLRAITTGNRMYSSLALPQAENDHKPNGKYHSLNLYQSLMHNYVKRGRRSPGRHHNGCSSNHHHHHHHHSSHRHSHHQSSRSRRCHRQSSRAYAHNSSARDTQACGHSNCCMSSSTESLNKSNDIGGSDQLKANVWGQLIKISKSDGSQVVELCRSPGKSWGFFVARGAINKNKGIFISRMHDDVTSSALSGLLSIGDRILAIDECPIEPDYDILRVNHMISKKSKIMLKVKPFRG